MLRSVSPMPSPVPPLFFDSSCKAPRHQNGMPSFCPPNTAASSTPMIGACSSMIMVPPTSRALTFQ
jgi:hypothetical protein